jgi:hypothetical protein
MVMPFILAKGAVNEFFSVSESAPPQDVNVNGLAAETRRGQPPSASAVPTTALPTRN